MPKSLPFRMPQMFVKLLLLHCISVDGLLWLLFKGEEGELPLSFRLPRAEPADLKFQAFSPSAHKNSQNSPLAFEAKCYEASSSPCGL